MKAIFQLLIFSLVMLLASSAFAAGDIDTLIQHAANRAGGGVYALRMGYLGMCLFGAFWLCFVLFNVFKWEFVSKCLSETKNGITGPSGFRLIAYLFSIAICYNETYTTMRKQVFDTTQLAYMLVSVGVCMGLIKVSEVMSIWKGGNVKDETPKQ